MPVKMFDTAQAEAQSSTITASLHSPHLKGISLLPYMYHLGYTFELSPRPIAPAYLLSLGFFTRKTIRSCLTSYLMSALPHIQASQQLFSCKYCNALLFE